MDFSLTEDQSVVLAAVDAILAQRQSIPPDEGSYVRYSAELQEELHASGFMGIAREEGFGLLDAALLAERIARCPLSVEAAASMLVAPLLGDDIAAPLALCESPGRPTRYLSVARHVCLLHGDTVLHGPLTAGQADTIDTVLSYPIGVLAEPPGNLEPVPAAEAQKVLVAWQVAIAAEAAGLMRGALDATVTYVKERRQFAQPLGNFQAIQHRLAICEKIASASFLLAMRAASSLVDADAAIALTYIQQNARTVVYDCHQFTGAMGVTLEYPLHLWTYRLKYLQGELGGRPRHGLQLSHARWPTQ